MKNQTNNIQFEFRPCPNGCFTNDKNVIESTDRISGVPGIYKIVKCNTCKLMRTNPRPTVDSINIYYPAEYGPYQSVNTIAAFKQKNIKSFLIDCLNLNTRSLPKLEVTKNKRLLEIGCANGTWLSKVASEGWAVQGIEFSETAALEARSKGLDVQISSIESAIPPEHLVDVVAAWMVLEHLHEPILALNRVREWVQPNGWLVASVPDSSSLVRKLFGAKAYDLQLPTHLYHYTPVTITNLLTKAGWNVTHIRWQRNANNLIKSFEYLADDIKMPLLKKSIIWFGRSRHAKFFRIILSIFLGVIRQSGRIEIWARPDSNFKLIK